MNEEEPVSAADEREYILELMDDFDLYPDDRIQKLLDCLDGEIEDELPVIDIVADEADSEEDCE